MDHGSDPNGAAKNANAVSYFRQEQRKGCPFIHFLNEIIVFVVFIFLLEFGYVREAERSYGLLLREPAVCPWCVQLPLQSRHDEEEKEADYFCSTTCARNAVHVGGWRWQDVAAVLETTTARPFGIERERDNEHLLTSRHPA